jgi:hypothetical protein
VIKYSCWGPHHKRGDPNPILGLPPLEFASRAQPLFQRSPDIGSPPPLLLFCVLPMDPPPSLLRLPRRGTPAGGCASCPTSSSVGCAQGESKLVARCRWWGCGLCSRGQASAAECGRWSDGRSRCGAGGRREELRMRRPRRSPFVGCSSHTTENEYAI